jgi:hypothetical protein
MTAERTKPCPDHASSNAIVARPSSAEAYHTGSLDVLNRAIASVYLAILIKCCVYVGLLGHTHQIVASSVRPASMKKSPRTLNSLPCEDAAPMRLWRLREVGTPRVLWRAGPMGGTAPADGMRFPSIGVLPLRGGARESSGWLLCEGRRKNDSGSSSTSGLGKSAAEGRDGNSDAFKNSLPSGLSRVVI